MANDLISRAAAIAEIDEYIEEYSELEPETGFHNLKWCAMEEAKDTLVMLPAVDAVPVVRCKDCKHRPIDNRDRDNDLTGFAIEFPDTYCPCQCEDGWYNWYPDDDWFCADGERRDSE